MLQSFHKTEGRDDLKMEPVAPLHGLVYTSAVELSGLSERVRPLLRGRDTLDPLFYLASISTSTWIPRVVAVFRGNAIAGVVYAKERKFAGIATGMIYIDTVFDSIVTDGSTSAEDLLEEAMGRLLADPGVRGIRLFMPPDRAEHRAIQRVVASRRLDVSFAKIEHHSILRLPSTFELFLQKLGTHTRRNFRYYRRRFEAAGGRYVEEMTFADFRQAALHLVTKDIVGADMEGLNRALSMLSAVQQPLLTGLQMDGEYIGILGGWYESGQATVFLQMNNDREHSRMSLCIVLRAYLIESMIGKRIETLLFWAGVGGPLARHTEILPAVCAYLDVRGFWWRTFRRIVGQITPLLPGKARRITFWIVPDPPCNFGQDVL